MLHTSISVTPYLQTSSADFYSFYLCARCAKRRGYSF